MKRRDFLQTAGGVAAIACVGAPGMSRATESRMAPVVRERPDASTETWMKGFPPPPERIIRFQDGSYAQWPQLRWSFCHIEELAPTRTVWRGMGVAGQLAVGHQDLSRLAVDTLDGRKLSLKQALVETYTDGVLIMHKGKIVVEEYFGHCSAHTRHIINSATKSYVGTIAQQLVVEGLLDRNQGVSHYLPELKDSAWGDAKVADVLDMLVGMQFDEDYARRDSEVYRYLTSMGMVPHGPNSELPISTYQYLPKISKAGEHNRVFAYREPNISVLGWLVRRVTDSSLTDLLSEKIWQTLGMDRDAYAMIDGFGAEGSLCMTLRDFARFGEMMRNRGRANDRQIFSPETVDTIFRGGDMKKFAAGDTGPLQTHSYVSQWWVRHLEGRNAIQARGAYGQSLYIDPLAEVVIARFGSAKTASSKTLEHLISPMHDAIVTALST